jgi:hypothetical protein
MGKYSVKPVLCERCTADVVLLKMHTAAVALDRLWGHEVPARSEPH